MGYVSLNEQYVLIDTLKPHEYLLQSLETKQTFTLNIIELASDLGVLYRLSPLTACHLGREYADYLKNKTAGFENKGQTLMQPSDGQIIKTCLPREGGDLSLKQAGSKSRDRFPPSRERQCGRNSEQGNQSCHLSVRYQLRSGDICYINHILCEEHTLSAVVLAAQPHLIQHFNAKDAFFIGASSVGSPSRM